MPDRIKRLVYLDAMVPNDGDSVITLARGGGDFLKQMTKGDYVVPVWHPVNDERAATEGTVSRPVL